ncbi:MAG TPA: hypothetical protein V6D17_04590 [Candidatus Obscuribacterales bacterium]
MDALATPQGLIVTAAALVGLLAALAFADRLNRTAFGRTRQGFIANLVLLLGAYAVAYISPLIAVKATACALFFFFLSTGFRRKNTKS